MTTPVPPDTAHIMEQYPLIDDDQELVVPGSARWYLSRCTMRLLRRQHRYNRLERYAINGWHVLPKGDARFVAALEELQTHAITNYVSLVISAVTDRMAVRGFKSASSDILEETATEIWAASDMDMQQTVINRMAATFGDTYVMVSPPDPDADPSTPAGKYPVITAEDPRQCIIERDPQYITKVRAGFKLWQDDEAGVIFGVLYLPDQIRTYIGHAVNDLLTSDTDTLTKHLISGPPLSGSFYLTKIEPNPLGFVPLFHGNWQPAFGLQGRCEAEDVLSIQDRINQTVLDRLVIAKSQAYNQRWVTGADPKLAGKNGGKTVNRPPFRPGADAIWAIADSDGKFGQFDAADLTQVLQAIRDDVGDMAAISKTPASFLMNRMVNVSGDTIAQDQNALVLKVHKRMAAMGWMYEKIMQACYIYMGETELAQDPALQTVWENPEQYDIAAEADAIQKLVAAGIPMQVIMNRFNYTPEEIQMALEQIQEEQAQQAAQAALQTQLNVKDRAGNFGSSKASDPSDLGK